MSKSTHGYVHVFTYPRKSEMSGSTGAEVPGSCELPEVGLGKPNLGHLEDQYMFFTTEATLAPHIFSFLFMRMCVCLCECMPCVCSCPRRPEEILRSPGTGVTGDCELPRTGAGKQTLRN